jgi:transposase
MVLPSGVAVNSVQFEMDSWTGAQCAFAIKSFYKNDSYVAAQCEFRKKFGIHRNSKVLSAHAIKTWVNNFKETGSTVKKKGGCVKTVRTPQNIDAVRASFERSPRWSAVHRVE